MAAWWVTLVVTLLVATLVLVALRVLSGRRAGRPQLVSSNAVVIVGPVDAGKTALFLRLTGEPFQATHTSMVENTGKIEGVGGGRGVMSLVDFPGHFRLRHNMITMLESVKPRRVVFVVDSSAGLAHMKEAAEGLYDLLSCKTVQDLQCPILLLCNKQDVAGAKAPADVHAGLMKQMATIQKTRTALSSTHEAGDARTAEEIASMMQGQLDAIVVAGGSVKQGNLSALDDFLRSSE